MPLLRARVRYGAYRIAFGIARATVAVATAALRVAPLALVAVGIWLFLVQPSPETADLDALIGIAGIVATVLSLGLTVTLLVAQHTAERHARVLYVEFRRERAWLGVLGLLGLGVVAIVAAALLRPTVSTGWASLTLAVALGVFAAALLPRLLDSLDRTVLAERITDRTVRELRRIAGGRAGYGLEPALKPLARRGLEIASVMAVQGVTTNDREVVRAGYAGMRRVLVAYVEGSPTRGWDTEVINLAFQHLGVVTDLCAKQHPVLILPAAIEELTALGVESQATLRGDEPEAVSIRLNSLFVAVVAQTLTNDQSAGPAMATAGIGESGMALLRAGAPNGVADHIRKLRSIALAALGAGQNHVAGTAHVQLSKLAVGLASMRSRDVMPPSLYLDTCTALGDSVDASVARTSGSGGLMDDYAWMWTTMPHMQDNLAHVVVAGVAADSRRQDRRGSDFAHGATALVHSLVKLATHGTSGFMTQSYAAETAYLAVLGAMALKGETRSPDPIPELWTTVVRRLIDPDKERSAEVEMLSSLLLVGVYEAESSRPTAALMRKGLREALDLTTAITDDFHRRRRARAWLGAGRAALGSGDEPLADAIAAAIAHDVRELRSALEGYEWRELEGGYGELFTAGQPFARPEIPDAHNRSEVIAAFDALLRKHESRRRPRRAPQPAQDGPPKPESRQPNA